MNFGSRLTEKGAAQAFTGRTNVPAASPLDGWLYRSAIRLYSVIAPQIPIGFQDAAGFHTGRPQVTDCKYSMFSE